MPDGREAKLVEAAERREVRGREGGAENVEVFRMGSLGTSILGGPRRLSGHCHTDSDYTLNCEEPFYSVYAYCHQSGLLPPEAA